MYVIKFKKDAFNKDLTSSRLIIVIYGFNLGKTLVL